MRITALAGGSGAAKLLRGLVACVNPRNVTVIVNTGDDTDVWGLHVSPDLDTLTYALTGRLDLGRGWGVAGDTFHALAAMGELGGETWFRLGDRDLATHLYRTRALRAGASLTEATRALGQALGLRTTLLPMSDDPVRTRIRTDEGWMSFQAYFVRERARVPVAGIEYAGAATARPGPAVLDALRAANVVVLCPSNPITSIGPILSVPGIREALMETTAITIAVSPIVGAAAVSGPAGELMRACGLPVSPVGVARAYTPWLDLLVMDRRDVKQQHAVLELGAEPVLGDIVVRNPEDEHALARLVLAAVA
jgi:LPPG:FO 2-phospho-L-lactate transferase